MNSSSRTLNAVEPYIHDILLCDAEYTNRTVALLATVYHTSFMGSIGSKTIIVTYDISYLPNA
jgi:hypothetical protein